MGARIHVVANPDPSGTIDVSTVVHESFHPMVSQTVVRVTGGPKASQVRAVFEIAKSYPTVQRNYPSPTFWFEETLVQVLTEHVLHKKVRPETMKWLLKNGFFYAPHLAEELEEFKTEEALTFESWLAQATEKLPDVTEQVSPYQAPGEPRQ